MKKVIFSNYDDIKNPYFGGGGAIAIHEVAKRLAKSYKTTVVTGKYRGAKNEKIDNVSYIRVGLDVPFSPQLSQFIFSAVLPYYTLTQKYDIWIESFTPPCSTGFLQLFTQKPVIGLAHMLSGLDMKRKYKLPFDLIEKIGLKTYKHIMVNTESVKNQILNSNKKANIVVVGNGVGKISTNTGAAKYALFIGRHEINQKGLDLLIKSWKGLTQKLIVAGGSRRNAKLMSLINKNGLSSRVVLVGTVKGQEKESLFKNAAFVVVPSRFETFSMTTLEAFSYGLPVVCFNIDGLSWTPVGATLKAGLFNTMQFAKHCLSLFKDKQIRKRMGDIGKAYAKKHTWDKIADKYVGAIESLI